VKLLKARMTRVHRERHFDLVLWLGDYAWRRVRGVSQVSFVQGPPGTDARAFGERFAEVRRLGGLFTALRWYALARLRLSPLGLPRFQCSDHLIVGSGQSKQTLVERYRIPGERVATLPYPIDLNLFRLEMNALGLQSPDSSLRILWLGRVVPRKRLDLFLDGAALAIRDGVDLRLTIVGGIGLVPGYAKLIAAFPFPERLEWIRSVPRAEVPAWLHRHDVLCQPSDEENFGSSVAEAQACGLPVIVGRTNGNADYLCGRDTHLADDRPETLASVFRDYAERKRIGGEAWGDPAGSRALAEREFAVEAVVERLEEVLRAVASGFRL
jgi:glycosyltransferase involved in cell wall biosynthesis